MRTAPLWILALGAASAAQGVQGGQGGNGEIKPFAAVDPYTKNDPDQLARAGYVSFGPFRLGDDHTTTDVVELLGGVPVIFVETAHFKLGSGLPEIAAGDDQQTRDRLKGELERLAAKLPGVKTRPKKLDPWLRLHLYAQRLEEAYAEFQARVGTTDADWPRSAPDPKKPILPDYMGDGPYLGMPGKYTVLVFGKKSSLVRYGTRYLGHPTETAQRYGFPVTGTLLYATAAELLEDEYANDSALAAGTLWAVGQNLGAGFRGNRTALPLFFSEGLGHWFARRFDERYPFFSGTPTRITGKQQWDWPPSVRTRVEKHVYPGCEAMLGWSDPAQLEWADHLIAWSRVDYLMARPDGAAGRFLRALKDPSWAGSELDRPLPKGKRALSAIGLDEVGFEQAWAAWVLDTYPKR